MTGCENRGGRIAPGERSWLVPGPCGDCEQLAGLPIATDKLDFEHAHRSHPLEGADEATFERGGGAEAVREELDDRLRRGTLTPAGDPTDVIWMRRRAAERRPEPARAASARREPARA
jgi:hypothetical protein